MNENAPCKGCPNRHTACHDSCEAYKEWRNRYHAQQKHFEENKNRYQPLWSAARERNYRSNTSFGGYVRKTGGMQ